jgi:hypothetical protein
MDVQFVCGYILSFLGLVGRILFLQDAVCVVSVWFGL